jgi:hypothetical protein
MMPHHAVPAVASCGVLTVFLALFAPASTTTPRAGHALQLQTDCKSAVAHRKEPLPSAFGQRLVQRSWS